MTLQGASRLLGEQEAGGDVGDVGVFRFTASDLAHKDATVGGRRSPPGYTALSPDGPPAGPGPPAPPAGPRWPALHPIEEVVILTPARRWAVSFADCADTPLGTLGQTAQL